jgi:hypothetical protein
MIFLIFYPSPMEKNTVIQRFDLFKIQNAEYNTFHGQIQEILYYVESRFWTILNNLASADGSKIFWCQKLLHRELASKKYYYFIHSYKSI